MKRYFLDRAKFRFQLKVKEMSIVDISEKMKLTRHTFNNWIRLGTTEDNMMLLSYHLDCTIEDLIK